MLEHPVYVRIPTEDEQPYFENQSSAEAVIGALITAQKQGWLRLHGFVVLPDALEVVMSPIRQGVSGVVAHLQAETTPILSILIQGARLIWSYTYAYKPILTQNTLNARLEMLKLSPVAQGLCDAPEDYIYSSANPRYRAEVSIYAGFARSLPPDQNALATGVNPVMRDAAE